MKTLHLHIGTPKTGTTSIQNFCVENAQVLEAKGYTYPLFPFEYSRVAKVRNAHFLVGMIRSEEGKRAQAEEIQNFEKGIQLLHKEFEKFDHVILSDESIWRSMDADKKDLWVKLLKDAQKENYQIQVIVYLRRQDKLISSHWNQMIKYRSGKYCQYTFDDYMKEADLSLWLDYAAKIDRVAEIIGKENIVVRRFDVKRFIGESIYADFLDTIGLTMTDEYEISQGVRNSGLYGNMHEIKRILNGIPQISDNKIQDFFKSKLLECVDDSAKNYPSEMMSKEEIVALLDKYEEGNKKITEEYLNEPGAELFDNTIKDVPKWEKENPYMIDDVIRFIGVTCASLYEENRLLKEKIKDVQTEVRELKKDLKHPIKTSFRVAKNKMNKKDE